MSTDVEQEIRKARIRYANAILTTHPYVACVCGRMLLTEDGYADHVETCAHVVRNEAAAGRYKKD